MTRVLAAVGAALAVTLAVAGCGNTNPNQQSVDVYHHYDNNGVAPAQPPATVLHIVSHVNAPPTTRKPVPTKAPAKPVAKAPAKATKR